MATSYTIKKGDTLSKIAKRAGTTVKALAEANGIANPNKIREGQTITLPIDAPAPAARTRALDTARTRYAYPTDAYVPPKAKAPIAGLKIPVNRKVESPAEESARMFKEAEAMRQEQRAKDTAAARDLGGTLGPRADTLGYTLPPNRSSANQRNVDGIPVNAPADDDIWQRLERLQQEQKINALSGNYSSGLSKLVSMNGKTEGRMGDRVRVADNMADLSYVPEVKRSPALSVADTDALVYTLLGEAEGEGTNGMRAVASAIMNRTRAEGFPSDPVSVVSQPKQFDGGPGTPRYEKVKALYPVGSDEYGQALRVVASHIAAPNPPDATGVGAVFFDTSGTAQKKYAGGTTVRIGNHFFYETKTVKAKQSGGNAAVAAIDAQVPAAGDATLAALSYNSTGRRNLTVAAELELSLRQSVTAVYGPGYQVVIKSGTQNPELPKASTSARHREDRPAADIIVIAPDGARLSNKELLPLEQHWLAADIGSVGAPAPGNGNWLHLDLVGGSGPGSVPLLPGEGRYWTYGNMPSDLSATLMAARDQGIGPAAYAIDPALIASGKYGEGLFATVSTDEVPLPRPRPATPARFLDDDRAEAIAYARESARQEVLSSLAALQMPQEIDVSGAPASGFETNIWGNGIEGLFDEIGQPSSVPVPALTRALATSADAGLLASPQNPFATAAPAVETDSARLFKEALAIRDAERARRAEESAAISDQRMVSRYGRSMPVARMETSQLESIVASRPDAPVGSMPAARYVPVVAGREERAGSMPAAEGAAFATSIDAGLLSAPQSPVPMDTVDVQVGSVVMPRPRPATTFEPYVYQIDVPKAAQTVREYIATQGFLAQVFTAGKSDTDLVAMMFEQKDAKTGQPMIPAGVVYDKASQTVTTSDRKFAAIIGGLNAGLQPGEIQQIDQFVRPILAQTSGGIRVLGSLAPPVVRPIVLQRKTVPISTIKAMMSSLEPQPAAKPKPPSMATVKPAWGASQPDLTLKAPGRTPQPGNPKTVGDAAKRTPVVETWSPMAAAKPVAPVYKIVPAVYKTVPVVPPAGKVASGAYNVTPEQRAAFGGTDARSAAVVAKAANGTQISAAPAVPAVPAQPQTKRVLVTPAKRIAVSPGGGITAPERRAAQAPPKKYTAGGRTYVVKDGMMVNEKTGVKYARTVVYGEGGGDYGSSPGQSTAGLKPGDRVYNADTNSWGLKR